MFKSIQIFHEDGPYFQVNFRFQSNLEMLERVMFFDPSKLGLNYTVSTDRTLYSISFHQCMGTFWFNRKTEYGSFVGITWFSLLFFAFCFHHRCAQSKMLFVAIDNICLVGALLTLFSKEALEVIHELKLYHTANSIFTLPQNLFFEQVLRKRHSKLTDFEQCFEGSSFVFVKVQGQDDFLVCALQYFHNRFALLILGQIYAGLQEMNYYQLRKYTHVSVIWWHPTRCEKG